MPACCVVYGFSNTPTDLITIVAVVCGDRLCFPAQANTWVLAPVGWRGVTYFPGVFWTRPGQDACARHGRGRQSCQCVIYLDFDVLEYLGILGRHIVFNVLC